MKRVLCLALCLLTLAALMPAAYAANTHPWTALDNYTAAKAAGNNAGIIKYGLEIIEFYKNHPDTDQTKLDVVSPKVSEIATAYTALGQWDNAIDMWKLSRKYGEIKEWYEYIREADYRIRIIEYSRLNVFTREQSSKTPYFGAKHEPKTGVLFGRPHGYTKEYGSDIKQNSIISVYSIYGGAGNDFAFPDNMDGRLLLINWNIPEDNFGILNSVAGQTDYIKGFAQKIAAYGKPVLLRFAGEMNVWGTTPDPEVYKKAFIAVATVMRANASNVAMVWSPSDVPPFYISTHDYYPGDQYVDWVGMSAYTTYDFLGRSDHNDYTNATFLTGKYASPLSRLEDIVSRYGERKPIILTESGIEHRSKVNGADRSAWATKQMEFMYTYLPMFFPQVKAVVHFDLTPNAGNVSHDLASVPSLAEAYRKGVALDSYLTSTTATAPYTYGRMTSRDASGVIPLRASADFIDGGKVEIAYVLDGAQIYKATAMPYAYDLDCSSLTAGAHTLEVVAYRDGVKADTRSYTLTKAGGTTPTPPAITVYINGKLLDTKGSAPEMKLGADGNNYVCVPFRAIFEALGASVGYQNNGPSDFRIWGEHDGKGIKLELLIGSTDAKLSGKALTLPVSPFINAANATLVPVRAVSESFNAKVDWDGTARRVDITT